MVKLIKSNMSKKENLLESINYQKGTIVSRTIINQPLGTVTLFAFDQGQGLSEHTAPYDALVYLFDGRADIRISGQTKKLASGDMIIMPADQPHSLKAIARFKMLLIMIKSKIK
ncbi:cupin [Candidatus Falkowbacteria bacterium RIFCSPLOWO2_12_FULL_45_13]|uniref:Cupin n=2 Tax=Candidatus Falkowiibacteriota TaxID=1752728 RepID=A0A1F5SC76_9BACT|nr:MAG: cupin [Candidatus Falkowbacteria bacterium RIFCSPLOWO2_02_FULL_45_21]OGF29869.1 MAG: cupin [Candidatus Falkowbacteria bacterium RIFCSPLOWO2_12_FULL_45_13]